MGKFKIGDRVECLDSYAGQFTKGKIYVVSADHRGAKYESVKVERDDRGSTENGWLPEFFKLAPTITIEPGKHYRLRNGKVTGRVSIGDIGFEALVDGQVKVFDKAGGAVFGGEDIVEAWVPKVGERVRLVKDGKSTTGAVGKAATISSWGDLVIDNNDYLLDIDPPVDYRTMSVKENFTRATIDCFEPLPVAAPLRIQAGRYYKTRDGRKVGPMSRVPWGGFCDDSRAITSQRWDESGSFIAGQIGNLDIIAEWVDEPVVAVANDNVEATKPASVPKFKVGDQVRQRGNFWIKAPGLPDLKYSLDGDWIVLPAVKTITAPTAIVALIEDGQPKPAERPFVHATEAAASKEAARLAGLYKGKQFGVYVLSSTSQEADPTYQHEWQRLAAKGEKINAIKELRSVTGMQLKPAKDVVEHFIDYPYGQLAA